MGSSRGLAGVEVDILVLSAGRFITLTFTQPDNDTMDLVVRDVVSCFKNTVTVSTFVNG